MPEITPVQKAVDAATAGDYSGKCGDSGDKATATDVLREVEKRVQRGAK